LQLYYIGLDSLILILYATVLICATLYQKETILNPQGVLSLKSILNPWMKLVEEVGAELSEVSD